MDKGVWQAIVHGVSKSQTQLSMQAVHTWTDYRYFYLKGPSLGFPGSSAGRESLCNTGDPGSIPGSGSSPGEGIGYSLQYSWASLIAQKVKNPPAVQETWVWSLGWVDPLEGGYGNPLQSWGFPSGSDSKESSCNAGDLGLILGLGRSPEEGNGNPLQNSCLENSMDREAWWATVHGFAKKWTRWSNWHFHFLSLHIIHQLLSMTME